VVWGLAAASIGAGRKFLIGISCRLGGLEKLVMPVHRCANFDAFDSDRGGEALEMVVVCGERHGGVVAAVEVVMVIMTFDGFLRGLPVAAVPENNFLQTGRLSTSRRNCIVVVVIIDPSPSSLLLMFSLMPSFLLLLCHRSC